MHMARFNSNTVNYVGFFLLVWEKYNIHLETWGVDGAEAGLPGSSSEEL